MKNTLLPLVLVFVIQGWTFPPPGDVIPLANPSFEDKPAKSKCPKNWESFTAESTPDILPGPWGVMCTPQDGKTCLGLITREDGTYEDVGQALSTPLQNGVCYGFSIYLAHKDKYAGYNMPIRLRIWGSTGKGGKEVLLATSPMINHPEWRPYKFQFVSSGAIRYIIFEAYYAPGTMFSYKGNILLDNCSPIERCDRA